MDKQFAATSSSPHVQLDVSGDLRLKGQDSNEVVAKADNNEDLSFEAHDDHVTIRASSNCSVRVPRAAIVQVLAVHGNAIIKALDGDLNVDTANGDLELRNLGNVNISTVNGNLTAKNIDGNLTLSKIEGDLSARRIQGNLTVSDTVAGNFSISDVGGNAKASADGNMTLRLDPAPGHGYEFTCHGNLFCRLSVDASAEISVPKASQVMIDLPGIHASAPVQTPYALTVGEGDSKITLTADGNVILDTHAPDWEIEDFDIDIGGEVNGMADVVSEQISQQVESQMKMIEDQLNAQLSTLTMRLSAAKLSADQAKRIEDRAREASERATARAQERMHRAQAKMEQKMAAMQRRMEARARDHERAARHGHHGWNFGFPSPLTPPVGEPVSEEERLVILRMLEEKKITMEEAEKLLSALEGKE